MPAPAAPVVIVLAPEIAAAAAAAAKAALVLVGVVAAAIGLESVADAIKESTDEKSDAMPRDQVCKECAESKEMPLGPGTLTADELKELQEISDKFGTPLDVVGSRAKGEGRNIEQADLPVGKGEGTRSDIDVRIDGQADIDSRGQLSDAVSNAGNGAGSPLIHTGRDPSPPVIQIRPNRPPTHVKGNP